MYRIIHIDKQKYNILRVTEQKETESVDSGILCSASWGIK